MTRLFPLDPRAATGKTKELFDGLARRGAGPMVLTMGHSPALLRGYLDLSRAMKAATLPRALTERVSIAVQAELGCAYCLEAHAEAARNLGVSEQDIADACAGSAAEPAADALIRFAVGVLIAPSAITDDDVDELRAHGYTDGQIGEVVGLVALNQLTGAFNLVAGLEPAAVA